MEALPLADVRVLDVAGELGAFCTKLLADFGADVLKVELGATQRLLPPIVEDTSGHRTSLALEYWNANKRGVELGCRGSEAVDALAQLAAASDVVVLAPSERHPLPGWDWQGRAARWVPESVVACVLTSFGLGGPSDRDRATHLTSCARSGLMWSVGTPDGPPLALPGHAAYAEFGAHAASVIVHALRSRAREDRGQRIEMSLHDMLSYRSSVSVAAYDLTGTELATRASLPDPPPAGVWPLRDGAIELAVFQPPQWRALLQLLNQPEALRDPDLADRGVRLARAADIVAALGPILARWSVEEFLAGAGDLRIPCAPLRDPADVTDDVQLLARDAWAEIDLPDGPPLRVPGVGFKSDRALARIGRRPAPRSGQTCSVATERAWPLPRTAVPVGPPLSELRVLSFGTAIAGNVTATMLAEMGADVVKIESPARPDPLRNGPISAALGRCFEPGGAETNVRVAGYARSCRSLTLDMKEPGDRDRFLDLVQHADVLIDNLADGVMEGWGVSRGRLASINPRLIIASASGYGRTGPRRHLRAYGTSINAYMGLTSAWSSHATECDWAAVALLQAALAAALIARDRTDMGGLIDLAQIEATAAICAPLYLAALNSAERVPVTTGVSAGSLMAIVCRSAGVDQWIALELEDVEDWNNAARILGVAGLVIGADPPDEKAVERMHDELSSWAASRDAAQAARQLQAVGIAASRVANIAELVADPQLWARGGFTRCPHPDLGSLLFPTPFQRAERNAAEIRFATPRLGENRDEVLADWLGATACGGVL